MLSWIDIVWRGCYYLVVGKGKGRGKIMENWELALMAEAGTTAVETITQSELELVIEECDTVPLDVHVVPDPIMGWEE